MQTLDVQQRFATLGYRLGVEEYNFRHFRPWHGLKKEAAGSIRKRGIQPGELAPDCQ